MIIISKIQKLNNLFEKPKLIYSEGNVSVLCYQKINLLSSNKIIIDDYYIYGDRLFIKMMDEYKIIISGDVYRVSFKE